MVAPLFVVCGLAAVCGVAWHERSQRRAGGDTARAQASTIHSIAVLPFADMSPQHDQEYFSDGMADEILSSLSRVGGLRVPGRTSSFYFKGKDVTLADVGRALHVDTVLEGSVRKDGSRLRVTARLLRVEDGAPLWSERYERDLTGVFAIQDEIASAVVQALKVRLSPGGLRSEPRPRSTEAYSEYLVGRQLLHRASLDTVPAALKHFERVVSLDPEFAPGWALLSITLGQLAAWSQHITAGDEQRAWAAAEKAIALAPEESIGYLARANLEHLVRWDWAAARSDIERALELGNSYMDAHNQRALFLDSIGRPRDAIAASLKATELDPLNPAYWRILAWIYLETGELELARSALDREVEISGRARPYSFGILDLLGGAPEAALATFRQMQYEAGRLIGTAIALHDLGRAAESDEALHLLIAKYGDRAYDIAAVHAWRGERDRAFEWLERAYASHNLVLARVKCDLLFRKLHGDPRWTALLRRMNLPTD
jgi:TolB-like protein